ncbi:hypothetical protein [Pyruvatibacter sp.]|uniref:hypothetical protein n=1 Tax=Pyruvatibacter sp. TaxID=1981328 RepID=UPI003267B6E0
MVKLPVFDVLGKAFVAPFKFAWPLLPAYIVLFGTLFGALALGAASGVFPAEDTADAGFLDQGLLTTIGVLFIGFYLAGVALVVLTHRVISDVPAGPRILAGTLNYILTSILLALIGILAFLLVGILTGAASTFAGGDGEVNVMGYLIGGVASLLAFVLGVRLFLALPAAALLRPKPIRLSWQVTRGNTLRLLGAWFLYFILIVAISMAGFLLVGGTEALMGNAEGLAGATGAPADNVLGAIGAGWLIVNVVVNYYVAVAGAAFLTYSLIALTPAAGATPDAAEDTPTIVTVTK